MPRANSNIKDDLFQIIENYGMKKEDKIKLCKELIEEFKSNPDNEELNFNVELLGQFDYTPLHSAVLTNNLGLVELFIKERADPTPVCKAVTRDGENFQAIYLAENFGKTAISSILRPYTDKWELFGDIQDKPWDIGNYVDLRNSHPLGRVAVQQKAIIFTLLCIGERIYNLGEAREQSEGTIAPSGSLPTIPPEIILLFLQKLRIRDIGSFRGGSLKGKTDKYEKKIAEYEKEYGLSLGEEQSENLLKNIKSLQNRIDDFKKKHSSLNDLLELSNFIVNYEVPPKDEKYIKIYKKLFSKMDEINKKDLDKLHSQFTISSPEVGQLKRIKKSKKTKKKKNKK